MRERGAHRFERGLTIIELLVVLMIVGGLLGMGVYLMSLMTNSDLRDEAMRMTSVIQYSYNQAALNNAQYRLVLNLDTGEYYTEITNSPVVVESLDLDQSEGLLPEEARELQNRHRAKTDIFSKDEADPFGVNRRITFERVSDGVVEPKTLEKGIRFKQVHTEHQRNPITSGRAAISFFPNGFQQQAIIVMEDERGGVYSLQTEPLTGRVRLYSYELDAPRDFGEAESSD